MKVQRRERCNLSGSRMIQLVCAALLVCDTRQAFCPGYPAGALGPFARTDPKHVSVKSVRSVGALALTCGFRDALRRLNPFGRSKSEEVRQKWEELQRSPDALGRRDSGDSRFEPAPENVIPPPPFPKQPDYKSKLRDPLEPIKVGTSKLQQELAAREAERSKAWSSPIPTKAAELFEKQTPLQFETEEDRRTRQEAAAADIERVLGKKLLQERENEAESQNRYDEERREIAKRAAEMEADMDRTLGRRSKPAASQAESAPIKRQQLPGTSIARPQAVQEILGRLQAPPFRPLARGGGSRSGALSLRSLTKKKEPTSSSTAPPTNTNAQNALLLRSFTKRNEEGKPPKAATASGLGDVSAMTGVDVPDGDMPVTVAGMQAAVAADEAAAPHASEPVAGGTKTKTFAEETADMTAGKTVGDVARPPGSEQQKKGRQLGPTVAAASVAAPVAASLAFTPPVPRGNAEESAVLTDANDITASDATDADTRTHTPEDANAALMRSVARRRSLISQPAVQQRAATPWDAVVEERRLEIAAGDSLKRVMEKRGEKSKWKIVNPKGSALRLEPENAAEVVGQLKGFQIITADEERDGWIHVCAPMFGWVPRKSDTGEANLMKMGKTLQG